MQRVAVLGLGLASLQLTQPRPNPLRCPPRRFALPIYLRPRVQCLDLPKLLQQRSFKRQSHPRYTPRPLRRVIFMHFSRLLPSPPELRRSCTGYDTKALPDSEVPTGNEHVFAVAE